MFSRSEVDLDQLSFGVSAGFTQRQLDETSFREFDPITGNRIQREAYFNVDVGTSYNYLDFYAHATIKNLIPTKRDLYTDVESNNLRRFIVSSGYVFGNSKTIQLEPSVLFQYVEQTREKILDVNAKAYKDVDFGKLWLGVSYRRAFDAARFTTGGVLAKQRLQYVTPVLGVNYKQFMFAYTYSHLLGNVLFDQGGFHQITLGINLFCKREKYDCNCPAIN
jgi:type IX secretion system PorP/SprF family membrane protein